MKARSMLRKTRKPAGRKPAAPERQSSGGQSPPPWPSLGRIVIFADPDRGDKAAIIVKVWPNSDDDLVNLLVFYDGSNDAKTNPVEWVTSVSYSATSGNPRTWSWPARL